MDTGGNKKKMWNLNSAFEKADSPPPPPTSPEKGVDSQKSVYLPKSSKTVFMNTVLD